jgi:hypothetical protein
METSLTRPPYYQKKDLWTLFLMAAFPTHIWTIILVLSDVEWVTERTNLWDAISVGAYGLIIALIESLFIFVLAVGLGFLILRRWDSSTRVGLLTVLIFLVSIWAIIEQLYFSLPIQVPDPFIRFLVRSGHPLWYLYGLSIFLAGITVLPLCYIILRSERARSLLSEIIERLSLLTSLYLLLDIAAIIIVVIRNVRL